MDASTDPAFTRAARAREERAWRAVQARTARRGERVRTADDGAASTPAPGVASAAPRGAEVTPADGAARADGRKGAPT